MNADVRPVKYGKWIDCGWSTRCSECGEAFPFKKRNFCPQCGADMRKNRTSSWYDVKDKLPEEQGRQYLTVCYNEAGEESFLNLLWYDGKDLWWNRMYRGLYTVTHWMPLPMLPDDHTIIAATEEDGPCRENEEPFIPF